jgi:hypothetical protein
MYTSQLGRLRATLFWHLIDLTASFDSYAASIYEKYIGREYLKEKQFFLNEDSKNILHIGSGAYPITALVLAKTINANITAIDKNLFISNIAKKVIKKRDNEFNSSITIRKGDGSNFPLHQFDTIIVSSCSYPKKDILQHVFSDSSSMTTIIVRELEDEFPLSNGFLSKYDDIKKIDLIHCQSVFNLKWKSSCFKKN